MEHIKLDYSLETFEERNELVKKIIENTPPENLTSTYLERMGDYLIFVGMDKAERRKQKTYDTDNKASYRGRRETSFQGLADTLESGEDGIYGMIANDKNIIFMPKVEITEQDVEEIPGMKELRESIRKVEIQFKTAAGKKKYNLLRQIKAMRQSQYELKNAYRKPIFFSNAVKSFSQTDLTDKVAVSASGEIIDNSLVSFFNPSHISALLRNYSKLKEDAYGRFWSDSYYLMEDLDSLIEETLREKYPLYYDLLIFKIDGKQNLEIQDLLDEKYHIRHSVEYISSLWRNKIPRLLAERATQKYLEWYYTNQKYGIWKKCTRCGKVKLAHNEFFSINRASKDGFYSICKSCRNEKAKKGEILPYRREND